MNDLLIINLSLWKLVINSSYHLDLLKKLLPHEYNAYLLRNGLRSDSRSLTKNRDFRIKRGVLTKNSSKKSEAMIVSAACYLG